MYIFDNLKNKARKDEIFFNSWATCWADFVPVEDEIRFEAGCREDIFKQASEMSVVRSILKFEWSADFEIIDKGVHVMSFFAVFRAA